MKRTIKKQFWFNRKEAELLQKKAKKACLTEAAFVRKLVRDEVIKEQPSYDFYDAMRSMEDFSNQAKLLANNIHKIDPITAERLEIEINRWHTFQAIIEENYLMPEKRSS